MILIQFKYLFHTINNYEYIIIKPYNMNINKYFCRNDANIH